MKMDSNGATAVILMSLVVILLLAMFAAEMWFRSDGAFFMALSTPFGMALGALLRHMTGESTPGLPPIPPSPGGTATSTLSIQQSATSPAVEDKTI